jgi:hypothetical protein
VVRTLVLKCIRPADRMLPVQVGESVETAA